MCPQQCFFFARALSSLKKKRQQRRGQRRIKNELIFYQRISGYLKVIYFVYLCQSYHETEYKTHRQIRNKNLKKLAEDGKEMYREL